MQIDNQSSPYSALPRSKSPGLRSAIPSALASAQQDIYFGSSKTGGFRNTIKNLLSHGDDGDDRRPPRKSNQLPKGHEIAERTIGVGQQVVSGQKVVRARRSQSSEGVEDRGSGSENEAKPHKNTIKRRRNALRKKGAKEGWTQEEINDELEFQGLAPANPIKKSVSRSEIRKRAADENWSSDRLVRTIEGKGLSWGASEASKKRLRAEIIEQGTREGWSNKKIGTELVRSKVGYQRSSSSNTYPASMTEWQERSTGPEASGSFDTFHNAPNEGLGAPWQTNPASLGSSSGRRFAMAGFVDGLDSKSSLTNLSRSQTGFLSQATESTTSLPRAESFPVAAQPQLSSRPRTPQEVGRSPSFRPESPTGGMGFPSRSRTPQETRRSPSFQPASPTGGMGFPSPTPQVDAEQLVNQFVANHRRAPRSTEFRDLFAQNSGRYPTRDEFPYSNRPFTPVTQTGDSRFTRDTQYTYRDSRDPNQAARAYYTSDESGLPGFYGRRIGLAPDNPQSILAARDPHDARFAVMEAADGDIHQRIDSNPKRHRESMGKAGPSRKK